ncbi:hypothetical protein [Streptomyces sp. x-19]|uniref:hypothetical protein n=1 Tax=Streptomyces sp. x-19 TaxID=2789280 RepID=UPI0039807F63
MRCSSHRWACTGVQDLGYGTDSRRDVPGYAIFDLAVEVGGEVRWLDPQELGPVLAGRLPVVPTLFSGPYGAQRVMALAEGRETLSVVSSAYLTRKGGAEYA